LTNNHLVRDQRPPNVIAIQILVPILRRKAIVVAGAEIARVKSILPFAVAC
jgi:hypothetical protein